MRVVLAMLCRHINLLGSPLYRLPPELFPEIASHLTSEVDLVNMTHVSHHSRNTLLSYPNLWSHLDFKYETRARAFFERSGQVSLHVDLARDTSRTVASLAELRKQSKRIATLKLRLWPIQRKFLSEPLPSLRRLVVFFDYPGVWQDTWDTTWGPVWGPTKEATSWSFPSLTSLIMYGPNLASFDAPNLTHFKLWDPEGFINTEKLIRFLDNHPLLEHIDISCVNTQEPVSDLVVSLPSLRTYTQTGVGEVCSSMVLNMLSLPPSCCVTLRSQDFDEMAPAADDVLRFKNPDYLAEIKRVKLGSTHSTCRDGTVVGTLELVNAKGTKVCSQRILSGMPEYTYQYSDIAHLDFFRELDGRSVDVLCINGNTSQEIGGATSVFLKEVLSLGGVRTLILSSNAVRPCLFALSDASDHSQWSQLIHTLVVHQGSEGHQLRYEVLQLLLSVAQKRKVAGFPFRSVSLFFCGDPWQGEWDEVLDELRENIEGLEVFVGDDALDWDVDKYFLDGLEHLQKNKDVEWGW